ncbi:MAG: CRTAC1 family protein [Rhizobiaceae bacterium]
MIFSWCLLFSLSALAEDRSPNPLPNDVPKMHEEALAAGIDHVYGGPWEFFVGGGAASLDCNGDRFPDLFVAGGKNPATLYVNHSEIGGALHFEAKPIGVEPRDLVNVLGAYPIDIDNDGYRDLVLLRLGENIILKGGPDCTFTKANRIMAFDGGRSWTTSFAATFEAGQKFPTLAFGNYVDRAAPGSPWGTCADNMLYRPQPGESPDYSAPLPLKPGYCALSMLFTDWDKSGTPSLRVANDRQYYRGGEEQLWRIDPGKPPRLYTRADGWRHLTIWGMGIAEADLDGDGYPEYAITSMGDTKLQALDRDAEEGEPVYRDIAFEKGATAHRPYEGNDLKPSTGWHSEFADFNNDGLLDLYIAKGNVEQMPDFAAVDPDNLLLGQWDGGFIEAGHEAGIDLPTKGRGAVVEDFNMDGMLDLFVVNREQRASLFRNMGAATPYGTRPMGNFVSVELYQKGPNENAVGAEISVRWGTHTSNQTVEVGGGHASGHGGFVHVGLGTAERASIRVKWPDGEWSAPYRVFANNFVRIERGAPAAKYWYPCAQ